MKNYKILVVDDVRSDVFIEEVGTLEEAILEMNHKYTSLTKYDRERRDNIFVALQLDSDDDGEYRGIITIDDFYTVIYKDTEYCLIKSSNKNNPLPRSVRNVDDLYYDIEKDLKERFTEEEIEENDDIYYLLNEYISYDTIDELVDNKLVKITRILDEKKKEFKEAMNK